MGKFKDINNKEWLVYVLDSDSNFLYRRNHLNISNEEFMNEAESYGNVYSLKGFEQAFNKKIITDNDIIRILYV